MGGGDMLFVRCDGELVNKEIFQILFDCGNRESSKNERNIQMITKRQLLVGNECFFISDMDEGQITIGAIVDSFSCFHRKLNKYMSSVGIKICNIEFEEVTLRLFQDLIENAEMNNFVRGFRSILSRLGINKIDTRRNDLFEERIICENNKENIYKNAESLFIRNTLVPELDRIYSVKGNKKVIGHPVHYMIESDDMDTKENTIDILVQSLYSNGRINSRRIAVIDFTDDLGYRLNQTIDTLDGLYASSVGGSIVIDFRMTSEKEGSYASYGRETAEKISELMNKYNNKVLTIFYFPKECTKIKEWFYEYLGIISFVELKEEFVTGIEAKQVLEKKAKERHVRSDKKLVDKIKEDENYLLSDLDKDFDEWFHGKLKRTVYPQYQCIETVIKKKTNEAPKGNSYDELRKMIGLKDAKQVIDQALDYYKAQKLFREKGMKEESPSMHMVFTGNPGTAKTTVARLFADIMKDNGILSTGKLVEVGRADLVGKFVGWTAPTVKAKFKDAKGGVLFIDEAYSLVDDRDGLYGDEAINTIVQEMENHRDEVIVIFAGYPDKMEHFLEKNPGLRSRIAFHVPFADYKVNELCDIAKMLADKKGIHFTEDAIERLKDNFSIAIEQSDFGNGRYVRNVIEKARMAQASRLLKMNMDDISREDILTFCAEDIEIPKKKKEAGVKMGFACS